MADSRRDKRKARLRDITEDAHGNMVYTGDSFRMKDPQIRLKLIAVLIALAAVVIGSGCIDAAGAAGSFYVIFPYIGEVSALFGLCWISVKVFAGKSSVRKYIVDNASTRIPGACRVLTVFAAAGLVLSVLYLIRNGAEGQTVKSAMYLLLKIAAACLAEYYRRVYTGIIWERS